MKDTTEEIQARFDLNKKSLAAKMFEDLGYLYCFPIRKPYSLITIHKDDECHFMIDADFEDIECVRQYQSISPELLLAFHQLFKELGWIE